MNATTRPAPATPRGPDRERPGTLNAREHIQTLVRNGLVNVPDLELAVKTLRQSRIFNLVTGSIEEPFRTDLIRSFERILELTKPYPDSRDRPCE